MPTTNSQSILFIDDEPDTLSRLKYIFGSHFDCYFANNGKAGLELFKKIQPPLVVCDVNLPDISGFQICCELKTSNPQLCLVLLSAYNDKETRLKGLESFADTYIDKSLSEEEIYLRIRNLHPNHTNHPNVAIKMQHSGLENQLKNVFSNIYSSSSTTRKTVLVSEVAKALALSPRSLQRKLKEETGKSFSEHNLDFRLSESKKYLQQGYSSTDISEMLGFSSPSHFSSSFKKRFAMTPSAYLHFLDI